ncbi:hypothetical protein BS78_05G022700 [Paspalum vaginatum]|nr:hypothetical protein BS78_05G022700 [Paspalum vaginatum]
MPGSRRMPSAAAARMPALPAGFRFHPTDEELVVHYLARQAAGARCPAPVVAEANIYACDPWELLVPAIPAARERYFFSPRDRKYPNGARPNRAAGGGYWKATGTDKPVVSERAVVGVKKALVFYSGRPPRGVKTDWVMHEYRLVAGAAGHNNNKDAAGNKTKRSCRGASSSSMRLDDWVLCRIYKKSNDFSSSSSSSSHLDLQQEQEEASFTVEDDSSLANNINSVAATLASPSASSPKSEAQLHHDGHQFCQSQAPTPMSKSCSLTDLLNTIDFSALPQMLLPDGGGGPEADAHAEPLIYHPELGTTAHTHLQQSLNYYNNNNNNLMNDSSSSSHFVGNTLLPPRAVDACCSDDNGLMMLKRKRTVTAAMDGAAGSSLLEDDDGSSKKLKLLPSDSTNPVGSYCNQLLVDTNNAADFQFQFQPSCSLMTTTTTTYNPFLQMQ